jgi:hypothetical protein
LAITKGGNMKNLKRAIRRHQKNVKHIQRLKKWANETDMLRCEDGTYIYNPNWIDVKENWNVSFKLKTMSTVCSCSMCAYLKYNRLEQKKINKMFLELGFNE